VVCLWLAIMCVAAASAAGAFMGKPAPDSPGVRHRPSAPALNMESWTQKCKNLPRLHWSDDVYWKDQNLCWEWMKHVSCWEDCTSWREGQQRAAKRGLAPFPSDVPMHPLRDPEVCDSRELGAKLDVSPQDMRVAQAWFDESVSVYVLNLPTDAERWRMISGRLKELKIAFRRIGGVDLRVPGAYEKAKADGWIPKDYNLTLAQRNARSWYNKMGGIRGTVGCATAHLRAQSVAAAETRTPYAMILEDDVRPEDDFVPKLRRLLAGEAPADWSAISLKSYCPYGTCVSPHLSRVHPDGNEPADRCRHGANYGFFAMLYRVSDLAGLRSRLARAVYDGSRPHCLDVDVALASISDEVSYYAVPGPQTPGLLSQGGFASARTTANQEEGGAAEKPARRGT